MSPKTVYEIIDDMKRYLGVRVILLDDEFHVLYERGGVLQDVVLCEGDETDFVIREKLLSWIVDFVDKTAHVVFQKMQERLATLPTRWSMTLCAYYAVLAFDFDGTDMSKRIYGSGRYAIPVTATAALELCDFLNDISKNLTPLGVCKYTSFLVLDD